MTEIISLSIIAILFSMMIFLTVRNLRYKAMAETRNRIVPVLLMLTLILMILDYFSGGPVCMRLSLDMMTIMVPLMFLASGVWNPRYVKIVCLLFSILQVLLMLPLVLYLAGVASLPSLSLYASFVSAVSLIAVFSVICGIWSRIKDVRTVMHSATALVNLGLSVDMVYVSVIMLVPVISLMSVLIPDVPGLILQTLSAISACSVVVAISIRLAYESFFAVHHGHERLIMESMKISQVEMNNGVREGTYRELYERIVEYFESEKPFLDNQLTINDVVKVVFSNKVYILRAISQFTGRNFCQFVNYYRISYSAECFRNDPGLRVNELAEMSGFNSVVSYNMAFRLFMNENPSDWCRKERQKIRMKKK